MGAVAGWRCVEMEARAGRDETRGRAAGGEEAMAVLRVRTDGWRRRSGQLRCTACSDSVLAALHSSRITPATWRAENGLRVTPNAKESDNHLRESVTALRYRTATNALSASSGTSPALAASTTPRPALAPLGTSTRERGQGCTWWIPPAPMTHQGGAT